jgi:hypothetical protein
MQSSSLIYRFFKQCGEETAAVRVKRVVDEAELKLIKVIEEAACISRQTTWDISEAADPTAATAIATNATSLAAGVHWGSI